jgi:hypothetical protein
MHVLLEILGVWMRMHRHSRGALKLCPDGGITAAAAGAPMRLMQKRPSQFGRSENINNSFQRNEILINSVNILERIGLVRTVLAAAATARIMAGASPAPGDALDEKLEVK